MSREALRITHKDPDPGRVLSYSYRYSDAVVSEARQRMIDVKSHVLEVLSDVLVPFEEVEIDGIDDLASPHVTIIAERSVLDSIKAVLEKLKPSVISLMYPIVGFEEKEDNDEDLTEETESGMTAHENIAAPVQEDGYVFSP